MQEIDCFRSLIFEQAQEVPHQLLPVKSKERYEKGLPEFSCMWWKYAILKAALKICRIVEIA